MSIETQSINAIELINRLIIENAELREENQKLKSQVETISLLVIQLQKKIKELEGKNAKNSKNNSSKPPTS